MVRQERWLLLPQTPPTKSADSGPQEGALSGHGDEVVGALIDRGLLVRLGTKEDVLDEGPTANLNSCAEAAEGSLERAAACARYLPYVCMCYKSLSFNRPTPDCVYFRNKPSSLSYY